MSNKEINVKILGVKFYRTHVLSRAAENVTGEVMGIVKNPVLDEHGAIDSAKRKVYESKHVPENAKKVFRTTGKVIKAGDDFFTGLDIRL